MLLSSFAVGITNPAAFFTYLYAFSYFEISGKLTMFQALQLVGGVFTGTYLWRGILSAAANALRKKTIRFSKMNRAFGSILTLFGTVVFVRAIR